MQGGLPDRLYQNGHHLEVSGQCIVHLLGEEFGELISDQKRSIMAMLIIRQGTRDK